MNVNEENIKEDPIYREELIRYRARLDEDGRINKAKAAIKNKESHKMTIINLVFMYILVYVLWFVILKPFIYA